jgi:hypothetical protein
MLCTLATYAIPLNGKKEFPNCGYIDSHKKSVRVLNCETLCCTMYQDAIQNNNSILSLQLDNCSNNSTSSGSYDSCLDAIFLSYQSTATSIFTAYSLCMYYSNING